MKKHSFLLLSVFLVSVFLKPQELSANTLTFPIKGFQTVSFNAVPIEVEWNENWFGEKSSFEYNHQIARAAGILAEVSYVDVIDNPKKNEIVGCYKAMGIKDELIELHYNVNYENTMWGNDQAAFSFATKQINSAKGKRNLIFVVIRGTPLNANEWISNLNISDRTQNQSEFHEGFLRATKQVENALISYLLKNKIDIEDCFLLITGHSRGAAIANLLSAQLYETDLFNTENIYTYTFAAPNVTTNADVSDPKYNYIWNIINAEDIVPTVPMNYGKWTFKKYGQTKTIINAWNSNRKNYEHYYLPQMNSYYNKFLERDFCPFMIGPFLPIQIAATLTSLNAEVGDFYRGLTALKPKAEAAFWKIFPPKDASQAQMMEESELNDIAQTMNGDGSTQKKGFEQSQGFGVLMKSAANWVYKQFNLELDYLVNSFIDMHAMEAYLSWILALPESDVYSDMESNLVILSGSGDYAVFNSEGKTIASIQDGNVNYSKIKPPIAANSFLLNTVTIGLPANEDFTIVLSKESILPTKLKIKVQHYSSNGILVSETEQKNLYPTLYKIYKFNASDLTINESLPDFQKVYGDEKDELKKRGEIVQSSEFNHFFEISSSSSGTINAGIHAGTRKLYTSILLGHNATKPFRSLELSPGLGNRVILTDKLLLDTEIFANLFYCFSDDVYDKDEYKRFNLVPSTRFSLSFKPKHRFQFFAAANLDLQIADFNDAAFDDDLRLTATGEVNTIQDYKIVPNFIFGIKF